MVNVVPSPSCDCTWISPLCCCMIWVEMARPSPVPSPAALVVKNGSKILAWVSALIPVPLSATLIYTLAPSSVLVMCNVGCWVCPIACAALLNRFSSTWLIWDGLQLTGSIAFNSVITSKCLILLRAMTREFLIQSLISTALILAWSMREKSRKLTTNSEIWLTPNLASSTNPCKSSLTASATNSSLQAMVCSIVWLMVAVSVGDACISCLSCWVWSINSS